MVRITSKERDQKEDRDMEKLSSAEREFVALGAALGSNCVPCIEYHIPEARRAGLSDRQIREAIGLADKVRQVPAKKVLATAIAMLPEGSDGALADMHQMAQVQKETQAGCEQPASSAEQPCCG
jgi:AhpD family alkylhydroperoxidase